MGDSIAPLRGFILQKRLISFWQKMWVLPFPPDSSDLDSQWTEILANDFFLVEFRTSLSSVARRAATIVSGLLDDLPSKKRKGTDCDPENPRDDESSALKTADCDYRIVTRIVLGGNRLCIAYGNTLEMIKTHWSKVETGE